ncbi:UNVERIFIED_CONTAM: hypothetical protein FKN15_050128 [Acipenser sinensis]
MNWHLGVTLADLSNLVTWAHSHGTICRQTPGRQGALQLSPRGECTVMWMCAAGHAYNWPFTPLLPVSTASNPWGEEEGQEGGQPSGRKRKRSQQKHSRRSKLSLCEEATNVSSDLSDCSLLTQASTENRNEHDSCNGTAGDLSVEEGEPGEEIQPKTEAPSEEGNPDGSQKDFRVRVKEENGEFWVEYKAPSPQNLLPILEIASSPQDGDAKPLSLLGLPGESNTLAIHKVSHWDLSTPTADDCGLNMGKSSRAAPPGGSIDCIILGQDCLAESHSDPKGPGVMPLELDECCKHRSPTRAKLEPSSKDQALDPPIISGEQNEEAPSPGCAVVPLSFGENLLQDGKYMRPLLGTSQKKQLNTPESKTPSRILGDIKMFKDWLLSQIPPETREVSSLLPPELDSHLAAFFGAVRRANGADFSANSLVFFHRGVERYLRSEGYGLSLTKSPEFSGSREALRSRFRELWRREKERETKAIEGLGFEEEEELRLKGVLSRLSPEGLLTLVLLNNTRAFGRAHLTQSWPVSWGDFRLVREAGVGDGGEGVTEYLEWRDLRGSEPHLRLYSTPENPERCPLQDFKEYVRRRSGGYLSPQDPLYVSCKPLNSAWEDTWYCRKALPKSKMEKMVKVLSQQVLAIRKKNGINSTGI